MFSCEFCEISKNTFFHRTPLVAASAFQTFDKMNNLDQKCCHMTLSESKNYNFQSNEKISIVAYVFVQAFSLVLRT